MSGEYYHLFLNIFPIWLVAVITPGPNFLITTQIGMERSRMHAYSVVLGIGGGTLLWSLAAFFGIRALFQYAPWLYLGLRLAGAAYLVFLGISSIRHSAHEEIQAASGTGQLPAGQAFSLGFLTNITNPKTALFISSLYAAAIPQGTPVAIGLACSFQIVAISIIWYGLVATFFSMSVLSSHYDRHRRPIKVLSGVLYIVLGIRLGLRHQ